MQTSFIVLTLLLMNNPISIAAKVSAMDNPSLNTSLNTSSSKRIIDESDLTTHASPLAVTRKELSCDEIETNIKSDLTEKKVSTVSSNTDTGISVLSA